MKRPFFKKNPGLFSSLQPSPADFLPSNKKTPPKGVQIRETIGFARPFSAHPSQKNPGIQQVFPDFSISSGRKMPRAKLLRTANREIFVSSEATGAGILDMYSEHGLSGQRCLARKDPVCGCRIPNLPALKGSSSFVPPVLGKRRRICYTDPRLPRSRR